LPHAEHFNFIAEKYKGAEVRGYINNMGSHEYFILRNNIIKYVFFSGESATEPGFWRETKYECTYSANPARYIEKKLYGCRCGCIAYTNIYYSESGCPGNSYLFVDRQVS
jgi:hypothetical protein